MIIDTAELAKKRVLDSGQILTWEINNAPGIKGSQGEDDCIHIWGDRTKVVLWMKPIDEMVSYQDATNPEPNIDPDSVMTSLDIEGKWSSELKSLSAALGLEGKYDTTSLFQDPETGGSRHVKGKPVSKVDNKGEMRTNIRDFSPVDPDFIPPAGPI